MQYYESKDFSKEFSIIKNIRWRHFRLVMQSGRFLKVSRTIRSPDELRKTLLRFKPKDVYYSTSCFMNPTKISARSLANRYQTMFLSNDIVFDIDYSPVSIFNLERARRMALKVISYMRGCHLQYIAFSGSKGFHLVYADTEKSNIADPYEREFAVIKRRKKLASHMKAAGLKFDTAITVDTRRILRFPGTINSRTGMACTLIEPEEMTKNIRRILAKVPKTGNGALRYLNLRGYLPKRKVKQETKQCYCTYLSNTVFGVRNRYIPFIAYKAKDMATALKRFEHVLKKAELPHLMLFSDEEKFTGVCLATYQRKELLNLLKEVGSENINELKKHRQNWLLLDIDSKECKPLSMLQDKADAGYWSRGHCKFFGRTHDKVHGTEDVKLSYSLETRAWKNI